MHVYIRNKYFSWGGASTIKDDNGNDVFRVKGSVFTLRRTKRIFDMDGNLLYIIKNRLCNWFTHRAYICDADKNRLAVVRDKFISFKREFLIDSRNGDDLRIGGKFFSLHSTIQRNGMDVAYLKRDINLFKDCFQLQATEEDMPFMCAVVIAMDNIIDNRSGQTT